MYKRQAQGFKRLEVSERFLNVALDKAKGLPWDLTGVYTASRPLVTGEILQGIPIQPPITSTPTPAVPRKGKVMAADIQEFGKTEGCEACDLVESHGHTTATHTDACRSRIFRLMEQKATAEPAYAKKIAWRKRFAIGTA